MPEESIFQTLDGARLPSEILQMLCRITERMGRIEISNCGGESCVVISKEELLEIESALEVLSNTDGGKALHASVAKFVLLDGEDESIPDLSMAVQP